MLAWTMVLYAKDIVETDFLSLRPEMDVLDAVKRMTERRHGFAIVADATGNPMGIVTEWDVLAKVLAQDRPPASVRLGEIMTRELVSVRAQDGIDRVAQVMTQRGVRRVLVVQDGRVLGVVTAAMILQRLKEYVDRISTAVARFQGPWV